MQRYEYKVVPAPARGEKAKGVKSTDARFALALTRLMNTLAADGWEYQRAETLPCEERTGLTRSLTVTQQHLLVFRRELETDDAPYSEADEIGAGAAGVPAAPALERQPAGPVPVPPLRPVSAINDPAVPPLRTGAGLRASQEDAAQPRRIVPLGGVSDRTEPGRE